MKEVIEAFDKFLGKKNLKFSATIIGGAALIVMDVIDRATKDVDCLSPPIPEEIKKAAIKFAKEYSRRGIPLKENWLNNGPKSLIRDLPSGWEDRSVLLYEGKSIKLRTLGRIDLLLSKLFAFCDRQQDLQDCLALNPTRKELEECYPWLIKRDANPMWPNHVKKSLILLAERLGYEFDI